MSEVLILWDIDGTLLRAKRFREWPLHLEVARSFGIKLSSIPFSTEGLSDSDIMSQLFALSKNPRDIKALQESLTYLDLISQQSDSETVFEVFPGVVEMLDFFAVNDIDSGILTGNTYNRARSKIERSNLANFFNQDFIFTCNPGESRKDIANRAHNDLQHFGIDLALIIGDTPSDIHVARHIGYNVISVATGKFQLNELAIYEPDLLIENLNESIQVVSTFIASLNNSGPLTF